MAAVEQANANAFTDEEAKVYDRQIRLWGIHAQQKIRSADVLVVGLTGLATEVVKNLVLSGINSITLIDDQPVTEFDMLSNLFTRSQVGTNRAEAAKKAVQDLNPMVAVKSKAASMSSILADQESVKSFIQQFHVVVLVNHDANITIEINKLCRDCNVPFFSACAWGYFSLVFWDLGKDFNGVDYVPFSDVLFKKSFSMDFQQVSKQTAAKSRRMAKYKSIFLVYLTLYKYHEKFGRFPQILTEENGLEVEKDLKILEDEILKELNTDDDQSWKALDGWQSKICGQFTFISSIVGGFLAQDVIRSVTKDEVLSNCFLFDGLQGYNMCIGF